MLEFPSSPHPLRPTRRQVAAGDGYRVEEWQFLGWAGDSVLAEVTLPLGDPAIVLVAAHGVTGSRKSLYIQAAARSWARVGVATISADAPRHGDRADGQLLAVPEVGNPELYRQAVGDLLRTVQLAAGEQPTAGKPTGFLGFSMGALTGVAMLATRPPVEAAVLVVAGSTVVMGEDSFPEWLSAGVEVARLTDPATYAPQVQEPAVMMVNADADTVFNRRSAFALYDALAAPKELLFFPGTHAQWQRPGDRYQAMLAFLQRSLAP